ncbi:glycerophosphoryl diester phosphodiesterase membrane domain-containing protein [Caryophanon latum]|uniref:GP-PDE domain-containing protein n=1 Tax=Caryophanon latum TaxID=33977 RepID=A0A1C0YTJ6_9BACL|nr:glycerophosphodiester phosphodiesterase [Caryophanon latum]OCS90469.1 hypothetical protein A6K76_11425 [Caryophanon latum]
MKRGITVLRYAFQNIYTYRVEYVRTFIWVRLLQAIVFVPMTSLLFYCMYTWTGFHAITEHNIVKFLLHPYAIILLAIWLLLVLLCIYYELGFYFLQAYYQQKGMPYTFAIIVERLNRKALYFFSAQSLLLVLYLIVLIPLAAFLLPVSLTQQLQLPAFIVDELMHSGSGKAMYTIAIIVLGFVSIRLLFTLPFFIIHPHLTIWASIVQSWHFSRKRLAETVLLLAAVLLVYIVVAFVSVIMLFLPLILIERIVPAAALVVAALTLTALEVLLIMMFTLLQALFSHVIVSVLYGHAHYFSVEQKEDHIRTTYRKLIRRVLPIVLLVVSIVNGVSLAASIYAPSTLVIAHRGFIEKGVENTISSLVASAEAGADVVEIDIQQTKDGRFVVFHDATLNRLANRSDAVYHLTLEQLTSITVSADGLSDTIPSLDDMLERAEELGVKLLVEVKTHGYETDDFLQRLVNQLEEHRVLHTVYVQSLNNDLMEELEHLEPRVKTGSVYAFHTGKLPSTTTDFYAIEDSSVDSSLIDEAKRIGKPLFVWTVNSDRKLQRYLEQNVDGLITNHPDVAATLRSDNDDATFFTRILHRLPIVW